MSDQDVFAKAAWRLIPFMMLLYIVNYIDRVNVGFAALTMNKDLAFSPAVYGFGAGAFFLGYSLFEVPSNLMLYRVGARRWLARIMISWGIVSAATAFVVGPNSFYGLRLLLGITEAGFFPGVTFFLAAWFSRYENAGNNWLQGFVIPLAIIGLLAVLVLGEVDLGTTALLGTTAFVVMFVAGAKLLWLGLISFAGLGALLIVATQISERMGRLSAFLHPQSTKDDAGLQQMQALIAWGSGGIDGLGLGNGRQKMLYLPYAHTDFIFPIIGEELGLRFSLLVVFLFVVIIVCGIMIALHAKDRFGLLLGCGVVSLLALQAAVNIGVTTSLLPNKGLPLPFISYGGSNLVACMLGVGLLLNIYRQGVLEPARQQNATMRVRTTPRI